MRTSPACMMAGRLLPTPDDAARIRLEAAARRYRRLSAEIPACLELVERECFTFTDGS